MKLEVCRLQLVRERTKEYSVRQIRNAEGIVKLMNELFDAENLPEEHVWLLCLDNKLKVTNAQEVSHGTANASLSCIRDIIKRVLLCGSIACCLVHNHPSGDCTPSKEDLEMTKKLQEACKLMEINLIDHLIIGDGNYISMKEGGML